ncbi:MAG: tRNA-dihydrouridine synthase [bacterium]|nr:tRNA-dihydrouridine synthase [bacterium]
MDSAVADRSCLWRLGAFELYTPWIMAPVAGYTNWAFQVLCRRSGLLQLSFTPMICAQALAFLSSRSATLKLLDWDDSCGPIAVQLFGDSPEYMAAAARAVTERGAAVIDINMGCTVPKIVKKGAGAAMLRHPDTACRVVEAVRSAVSVPITAKMRLGWRCGDGLGLALARRLQDLGVSAFFVHGRYAEQAFAGAVDYEAAAKWRNSLRVPVIGNGDVLDGFSAVRWQSEHQPMVMLGRGLLGDPWLLERLEAYRLGRPIPEHPSLARIVDKIAEHWALAKLYSKLTEVQTVQEFRSHLAQYCRKHRRLLPWRERLLAQRDFAGLEGCLAMIASPRIWDVVL